MEPWQHVSKVLDTVFQQARGSGPAVPPSPIPERKTLKSAGRLIGEIYNDASFETCEIKSDSHDAAIELVRDFCAARRDFSWLQIVGKPGCGKTHLEACGVNYCAKMGISFYFNRFDSMLSQIGLETTRRDGALTIEESTKIHLGASIIFIDDCGISELSPLHVSIMNAVFDYLYRHRRRLVFTHNIRQQDRANFFGPRISSRFSQVGKTIECDWPSFRGKESK